MVRPENETKYLLLPITRLCETLIKQTHKEPQAKLVYKFNKPRETLSFKPSISVEGFWMVGLTSSEVDTSIFDKTVENGKFEIYADRVDQFSFTEMKDELEEILDISNI